MDMALDVEARCNSIYGNQSYQKKKDPYVMNTNKVKANSEEAPDEALS